MKSILYLSLLIFGVIICVATIVLAQTEPDRSYDRFNYAATTQDDLHYDFGPEDWGSVQCPDLATCVRFVIVVVAGFDQVEIPNENGRMKMGSPHARFS
jgi:hypothetical protein